MRPVGEIRLCLEAALIDGPGTSRQLAQRIGAGFAAVTKALDNMVTAGVATKGRPVRVPGVKRSVPVYHRAVPAPQADEQPLQSLIAMWVAGAHPAHHAGPAGGTGAAM